jgi:Mn2+/Fe2+ NRAMP family transporter
VPYNLFLHAAAARKKWESAEGVAAARTDTRISIGLGGLISILIIVTAASTLFEAGIKVTSAADMAIAIEPAFGSAARYLIGIGLFAAGLTSAITAPMATAYALTEMLPSRNEATEQARFRAVALTIIAIGAFISMLGLKPVSLILIAQTANGLLLPVIATFLLIVMNRRALLGEHTNGPLANIAGVAVILITFGLGLRGILRAFGIWP